MQWHSDTNPFITSPLLSEPWSEVMLDVSMGILTEPFKFGKKPFGKIITF